MWIQKVQINYIWVSLEIVFHQGPNPLFKKISCVLLWIYLLPIDFCGKLPGRNPSKIIWYSQTQELLLCSHSDGKGKGINHQSQGASTFSPKVSSLPTSTLDLGGGGGWPWMYTQSSNDKRQPPTVPFPTTWSLHIFCTGLKPIATWE